MVELLVSMTIGLLLLGVLVQVFANSKHAYQIQNSLGLLQENGRFATEMLAHSIRMANHWGGVESDQVTVGGGVSVTATGGCDKDWVTDTATAIRGYQGAATISSVSDFPANCIANADYVADSDIIVIRYADATNIVDDASLSLTTPSNNADRIFVRSAVGQRGELLMGDDAVPGDLPAQNGTYNFPYTTEVFFLRPCSVKTSGNCTDGISTLTRLKLGPDSSTSSSQLSQETLVENIEQMQFQYGSDTDNDNSADRYDNASAVPDWAEVVSVRLSIFVSSDTRDSLQPTSSSYTLLDYTYTRPTADRSFNGQVYNRYIQIRNRGRN